MPIKEDEGIVLRSIEIKEIDKIVTIFSKEHGIVKGVAKGAGKFHSRFGASLEPLSYIRFIYYEKEGKELFVIKTAEIVKSFFEIQKDIKIFNGFSQMAELMEEFVPPKARDEIVFRLLKASLEAVSIGIEIEGVLLYFKYWLLKASGLLPNLKKCKVCKREGEGYLSPSMDGIYCRECAKIKTIEVNEDISRFLAFIFKNPPCKLKEFQLSETEKTKMEQLVNELILHNIEKLPKTLSLK